ncbi:biotin transporter BioY [Enterococcus thailandicus]|uniref:Biotin transporter n=1 Tax=Enterococcus thailandicus TaxID=417368 RepID=A0A179ESD5_ENTTH|nr:biotin transporter BioY [Enterococcus thailandicus]MDK4353148.1 biotin transporter BioY [Enterococcus thailandicus]MDT2733849.1 biotin transporter BioY [Enterococcus thailandicus]MDT2751401.1 biotin transporter BioY [Enterococcus thailandicus]MDT2776472.1 biotin transporter BioY [Enterococcus thailandicus]MDT2794820.1 biotin transporter BioY [Enterococcus thailandicus]
MKTSLKPLIIAAEFSAIIAILSQFTIPLGIVPLTGQTFAIGLTATLLGRRSGTLSVLIYLLLGTIGLPVFAGLSGGLSIVFGPTGGYLIGFIFQAWLTGYLVEKNVSSYTWVIFANVIGSFVTLIFGVIWLKASGDLSWNTAIVSGFIPFILPGIIKAVAAGYLGTVIRHRLPNYFSFEQPQS